MKFKSPWLRPKRLGSLIVIEALLAQAEVRFKTARKTVDNR